MPNRNRTLDGTRLGGGSEVWIVLTLAIILGIAIAPGSARAQCVVQESEQIRSPGPAWFGYASLDGNVALVSAPLDDGAEPGSGTVYAYRFNGSAWDLEQRIYSKHGRTGDVFGFAHDLRGDLAVIASSEARNRRSGVDVFRFDGRHWIEEQRLRAFDETDFAQVGTVAVFGDTIAVGAYDPGDFGRKSGAVYLFRFDGDHWVEEQRITASDRSPGDNFGISVALDADRMVVGSDLEAAYVYRRDGSRWVEEQRLTAPDGDRRRGFGHSVSIEDPVVVIGAPRDDEMGPGAGAAYVFRSADGRWSPLQKLTASDGSSGDAFGYADLDRDQILVGAFRAQEAGRDTGAAYLFQLGGTGWSERRKFIASDAHGSSYLGLNANLSAGRAMIGAGLGSPGGKTYVFETRDSECTVGSVNLGSAAGPEVVLTVNASSGDCVSRTVSLGLAEPFEISMAAPPAGPETAPFALYAWVPISGAGTLRSGLVQQPFDIGATCFATFLSGGGPKPIRVWNNVGRVSLLGRPDFPSSPAPSIVLSRPQGWPREATVAFQGIILDDGSAGRVPASVTNAVVLRIGGEG